MNKSKTVLNLFAFANIPTFIALSFTLFSCVSNSDNLNTDSGANSENVSPEVSAPNSEIQDSTVAIVIHGGAGTIRKDLISDSLENSYISTLDSIVNIGYDLLNAGVDGLDVVTKVISMLEDSPLFNAGKGAVFTHDKTNELDASIMHGRHKQAGAVAGVKNIKNPIYLAQAVMLHSSHVLLSGKGAEEFADMQGIEKVDPSYFYVQERMDALKRVQEEKHGTVGCVVLDINGDIIAGTSTGGMTNKRWGRIGDSPIIGAGTYADNSTCGVSSTGWGEFFIRGVIAYDIAALMEYKGYDLNQATNYVIQEKLTDAGGTGGIIALDKYGNVSFEFNTDGMFRACVDGKSNKEVAIYK